MRRLRVIAAQTAGDAERFIAVGVPPERVRVGGREATLIVWSPDYDGKGKAWLRYDDGEDALVGGSRVQR